MMPTFLHIANIDYPARWHDGNPLRPLEGRNLIPLLQKEKTTPPEKFHWSLYGHSGALDKGRWKLMVNNRYDEERERHQAASFLGLYDLESDAAETDEHRSG